MDSNNCIPKERLAKLIAKTRIELETNGVFKKKQRQYAKGLIWHKDCIVCGQPLPAGMARVCSSQCYLKAPIDE